VKVGRHLGLGESELRELEYAAILHDIGRTAIQHNLWGKAGRLTKEEQTVVRHHPSMGAVWIRQAGFFPGAAGIVESHHEQPDGKGYPQGLRGDAIPLGSRIIMGVAAFDAMTSDRPYRKGLSPEEAFEELLSHSGTQFFSDIVATLIELYSKGILFEEFEDEVLEQYREGERSSRALERFLSRTAPVPTKRGIVQADDGDDDVPMIDFPEPSGEKKAMESERDFATGGSLRLRVASRSDVGCVRTNNEDSFGAFEGSNAEQGALLVLADGMGGAAAGEVASRMAVENVYENYFDMLDHGSAAEALRRSMASANAAIHARASEDPVLLGMGTTCTAVSVVGQSLNVGHVGDSRAYLIEAGQIRILTRDHTLAAELAGLNGGQKGAPEAARNILTRCLGNQPNVQIDVFERPLELHAGSVLVLCSDGLSNQVSPSEILDIAGQEEPAQACAGLVALARERGGPDNITVQVARLDAA
jgi:protein phosphatase